jgi:hypothetical protein
MISMIARSYRKTRVPESILIGMLLGLAATLAALMYALH